MKKRVIVGLLTVMTILSACAGGSQTRKALPNSGQKAVPSSLIYIYSKSEIISNRDGTLTVGEIRHKDGTKTLIKIPVMSFTRGRGSAPVPPNSEYDAIIAVVTEAINKNPQDKAGYIQRATILLDRGRPEDLKNVINDCNTVLKIDDSEQAAYYIRGMASAMLGDFDQSISDMVTIINIREHDGIGIRYVLAQAYNSAGKVNQAIEMMESVVKIDPGFADASEVLESMRKK